MKTIKEYNKLLKAHDWFHAMSDDHRAWQKGQKELQQLMVGSKLSNDHQKLYRAWHDHHFSGEYFDKPQTPAPDIHYFHHGESDCVFIEIYEDDIIEAMRDCCVDGITAESYEFLKEKYNEQRRIKSNTRQASKVVA